MKFYRSLISLIAILLVSVAAAVGAQSIRKPVLTGTFAAIQGDRRVNGHLAPIPPRIGIYDVQGVYHSLDPSMVKIPPIGLTALSGKMVDLYNDNGVLTVELHGITIALAPVKITQPLPLVTGPQPMVQILCNLPGSSTPHPHPVSFYQGLYRSQFPSLENYWETMTFGKITQIGPNVFGWYEMPFPMSHYGTGISDMNLRALRDDCTTLADHDVNFPQYVAVNMMFNVDLGAAWGGREDLSYDGVTKEYGITWYSNYDDPIEFLAHEYGHIFNMDHSCGSLLPCDEYGDPTTVMSQSVKCDLVRDPVYGCISQGLDSWDLYHTGYLDRPFIVDRYGETVLAPLRANTGKTQVVIALFSETQGVFIENRSSMDYDSKLPVFGLAMHFIDIGVAPFSTFINAARNGDDWSKGAYLTKVGKYTDPGQRFTVCVKSISGGDYTIAVGVGVDCSNPPPPSTNTPVSTETPLPTAVPTNTPITIDPSPTLDEKVFVSIILKH